MQWQLNSKIFMTSVGNLYIHDCFCVQHTHTHSFCGVGIIRRVWAGDEKAKTIRKSM